MFSRLRDRLSSHSKPSSHSQPSSHPQPSIAKPDMNSPLEQSISRLGWDALACLLKDENPSRSATISPLSISIALGMLAGGADTTRQQIFCDKLGVSAATALQDEFRNIHTLLAVYKGQSLEIANIMFACDNFPINPSYKTFLNGFAAESKSYPVLAEATGEMNKWISDNTKGLITDLLTPESLRTAEVALVNTLAFKGTWKTQFNPQDTEVGYPFHVSPNQNRQVEMMFQSQQTVDVEITNAYTAVRLRYQGPNAEAPIFFVAMLPAENKTVMDLLSTLRDGVTSNFRATKVSRLGLPKFEVRTNKELTDMLQQLGYPVKGQYPRMSERNEQNQVEAIIHEAFVKVNEEGTEAAAATVVTMSRSLSPKPSAETIIIFDRPFVFTIESKGVKLFAGVFS